VNRSVAATWESYNESIRTGHSGNKTEELMDETDFASRSGVVAGKDLFSSRKPRVDRATR
jgi:hypothetical protein